MTLRGRADAEADAELDRAIDWYADRSRLIATEFIDAIESELGHIAEWPDSGRPYVGRETLAPLVRTKRVRGFPYRIVYFVDGEEFVIVAYQHERQRPGYWTRRLPT